MTAKPDTDGPRGGDLVRRHAPSTRLWHWISAGLALGLVMSGLMIFNAHPRLYWGQAGAHYDPAWLEIGAEGTSGYLRIGTVRVGTTGFLGYSEDAWGDPAPRAFPAWATLPAYHDLAEARRWHIGLAWPFAVGTLIFGLWSLANGHVRRDLLPTLRELRPRALWHHCKEHARFRLPKGADAMHYNILQKLFYLGVTAILLPLIIYTGLCMSPLVNAAAPWMLDLIGGRQTARSLHFIAAFLLVAFVVLHVAMVVAAGPVNELRSMITGWFRLPKERER